MSTTTPAPEPVFSPMLRVYVSEPTAQTRLVGRPYYRMRFEVVENEDIPEAIFVHQSRLLDGEEHYEFMYVATPISLIDLPDEATTDGTMFRLNYADFYIESPQDASTTVNQIKTACQSLVDGLKRLNEMSQTDEIVVS